LGIAVRYSHIGGYVIGIAAIMFGMVMVAGLVAGIVWVALKIF
jgi:hypothetical protein